MANAVRIERKVPGRIASKVLDVKLGFALLKDRRVPLMSKAVALALGVGALVLVSVLELPVEEMLAALVPLLGVAGDLVLDGVEVVVGPFLVACLALPYLAPAAVVAQIRRERAGIESASEGPVIDV